MHSRIFITVDEDPTVEEVELNDDFWVSEQMANDSDWLREIEKESELTYSMKWLLHDVKFKISKYTPEGEAKERIFFIVEPSELKKLLQKMKREISTKIEEAMSILEKYVSWLNNENVKQDPFNLHILRNMVKESFGFFFGNQHRDGYLYTKEDFAFEIEKLIKNNQSLYITQIFDYHN